MEPADGHCRAWSSCVCRVMRSACAEPITCKHGICGLWCSGSPPPYHTASLNFLTVHPRILGLPLGLLLPRLLLWLPWPRAFAAHQQSPHSILSPHPPSTQLPLTPSPVLLQEFERQERDRQAEAEVRAQAAELRQLKADGLLGVVRSAASPRPQAYIPEEEGVPKPFPAAFRPFKPFDPPAAVALAAQKAASVQQQQQEAAEQGQQAAAGMPLGSGMTSPALASVGAA